MSGEILSLLLDIVIMVFLGVMIFFALRLSNSLNAFRAHRQDFDTVISDLLESIAKAEKAIQTLKETGEKETSELRQLLRESRALSEELRIINEAGDSMAKRMEVLAEKNSKIAQSMDQTLKLNVSHNGIQPEPWRPQETDHGHGQVAAPVRATRPQQKPRPQVSRAKETQNDDLPSFMIKDREFAEEAETQAPVKEKSAMQQAQAAAPRRAPPPANTRLDTSGKQPEKTPGSLKSKAEQELYEALLRNANSTQNNNADRKSGGGRA